MWWYVLLGVITIEVVSLVGTTFVVRDGIMRLDEEGENPPGSLVFTRIFMVPASYFFIPKTIAYIWAWNNFVELPHDILSMSYISSFPIYFSLFVLLLANIAGLFFLKDILKNYKDILRELKEV